MHIKMSNYAKIFAGRKTRARFEEIKHELECNRCKRKELFYCPPRPGTRDAPGGQVKCQFCGYFQCWLSLEKNEEKRRAPKYKVDEVWVEYGNRCSFCGVHKKEIELFGIGMSMTVQHAPPLEFSENGHFQGVEIPCCAWCQQQAASWQKRIKTLVAKLAEKMDVNRNE